MGHLNFFQRLAIVNSAATNMGVQVAVLYPGTHSFRCTLKNVMVGTCGISIFSFLRNLHKVLIYIPTNSVFEFLFSHSPCQHLWCVLLVGAILIGVRWNLNTVKDVEHFFHVFIGYLYFILGNCLFSSFAHLFVGLGFWASCEFWLLILCQVV
jgi:hypothetical protein